MENYNNNWLDLNSKPLITLFDQASNKEVQSNFFEFGLNINNNTSMDEEADKLGREVKRVSEENKKLSETLAVMSENYYVLRGQLMEYLRKDPQLLSRKRKIINNNNGGSNNNNNGNSDSSSTEEEEEGGGGSLCKRTRHINTKISKLSVRTEASDASLTVKDGYQWRKYGQKVTRDNPCPRAYFKCSFAPTCPVKKKVQRSVEDQSILVATYEGEHNHPNPTTTTLEQPKKGSSPSPNPCLSIGSTSLVSSGPSTVTLDLTKPNPNPKPSTISHSPQFPSVGGAGGRRMDSPEFQQFLVDQMASSLTKDPSFKAALAAAISGKVQQQKNQMQKW